MSDNLELWNSVFKTDLKFTKPAKKGAYQFTSISPMYQKFRATEAMGPQGIGWGVKVGSESWEYKEVSTTTLIIYRAIMFFSFNGEKGEIPINAMEKLSYQTQGANGYLKIDDEADKKVRTAALTKGLSEIGVSADVHMNLHTDHQYSEMVAAEIRIKEGDNSQLNAEKELFKSWFEDQVRAINLCPNDRAVKQVVNRLDPVMQDKMTILKSTPQQREIMTAKLYKSADNAIANLKKG